MNSSSNSTNDDMQITVSWDIDTWPDLSYLGEYTGDADAPGAIDRAAAGYFVGHNQYRYFVPATSEDEHYKGLITIINPKNPAKKPYGKRTARAMARQYVLEDLARMEAYEQCDWCELICKVVISWKGVEIGRSACYGLPSDCDYCEFADVYRMSAGDAYDDAVTTMTNLNSADRLPALDLSDEAIADVLRDSKGCSPHVPRKVAA